VRPHGHPRCLALSSCQRTFAPLQARDCHLQAIKNPASSAGPVRPHSWTESRAARRLSIRYS